MDAQESKDVVQADDRAGEAAEKFFGVEVLNPMDRGRVSGVIATPVEQAPDLPDIRSVEAWRAGGDGPLHLAVVGYPRDATARGRRWVLRSQDPRRQLLNRVFAIRAMPPGEVVRVIGEFSGMFRIPLDRAAVIVDELNAWATSPIGPGDVPEYRKPVTLDEVMTQHAADEVEAVLNVEIPDVEAVVKPRSEVEILAVDEASTMPQVLVDRLAVEHRDRVTQAMPPLVLGSPVPTHPMPIGNPDRRIVVDLVGEEQTKRLEELAGKQLDELLARARGDSPVSPEPTPKSEGPFYGAPEILARERRKLEEQPPPHAVLTPPAEAVEESDFNQLRRDVCRRLPHGKPIVFRDRATGLEWKFPASEIEKLRLCKPSVVLTGDCVMIEGRKYEIQARHLLDLLDPVVGDSPVSLDPLAGQREVLRRTEMFGRGELMWSVFRELCPKHKVPLPIRYEEKPGKMGLTFHWPEAEGKPLPSLMVPFAMNDDGARDECRQHVLTLAVMLKDAVLWPEGELKPSSKLDRLWTHCRAECERMGVMMPTAIRVGVPELSEPDTIIIEWPRRENKVAAVCMIEFVLSDEGALQRISNRVAKLKLEIAKEESAKLKRKRDVLMREADDQIERIMYGPGSEEPGNLIPTAVEMAAKESTMPGYLRQDVEKTVAAYRRLIQGRELAGVPVGLDDLAVEVGRSVGAIRRDHEAAMQRGHEYMTSADRRMDAMKTTVQGLVEGHEKMLSMLASMAVRHGELESKLMTALASVERQLVIMRKTNRGPMAATGGSNFRVNPTKA